MERSGHLPDRCVTCNRPAASYRLTRKLYWSPLRWRVGAFLAPVLLVAAAAMLDAPALFVLFWPVVLVLVVVNAFVRKALPLEFGVCRLHRRMRAAMLALSLGAVGSTIAALALYLTRQGAYMPMLLVFSVAATLILVFVHPFVGVQRLSLRRLDAEHAWLAGTGRAFREALPDQPR